MDHTSKSNQLELLVVLPVEIEKYFRTILEAMFDFRWHESQNLLQITNYF